MYIIILMIQNGYIFRGRCFTQEEIQLVQDIVQDYWSKGRTGIARIICERLDWRQLNGRLKETACLEALRKMEKQGLLNLPSRDNRGGYQKLKPLNIQEAALFQKLNEKNLTPLEVTGEFYFALAKHKEEKKQWRYFIQRDHYLGYQRLVGRHLQYLIYLDGNLVALLGFADGIYHHHLRDNWIGWNKDVQEKNRHLVVNNVRFLILPWVRVKNLASRVLSLSIKIMPLDWQAKYGYKPLLVETFVDCDKFKGTCYKAANWIYLGRTCGKGRRGARYFYHGKIRDYYVYPLDRDALAKLKNQ